MADIDIVLDTVVGMGNVVVGSHMDLELVALVELRLELVREQV
jgi:hypothetical protein